ncbi:MAG: Carbon monoxide dehydrogenase large chain [Alphaproteobacteria bacterium MarineAlpha3_Bin7]|nr:MAG: Carbon monoxide dehydrogenase large chain [Alphaproteobacteria bacterium MarineAlpha3_Bin7]|tara:strand:+ start:716 stop:3064 length:2349 start_codon:yes stop_codon:yes gene_type:complete
MYVDVIGKPINRREDERFLTGKGQYSDDLTKDGQYFAVFVRSQIAHAKIISVDTDAANQLPGVITVLSAKEYVNDGKGPIPHKAVEGDPLDFKMPMFGESPLTRIEIDQWPMANDKIRHIGELIAVVIAETVDIGLTAASLVNIEIEEIPSMINFKQATAPDAPIIHEKAPGNIVVHHRDGNPDTEDIISNSDLIVEGKFNVPRLISCQMEPRSGLAEYDKNNNQYVIIAGNQGVHRYQQMIAGALKVDKERVRVICPDTGGGFGSRGHANPEFIILAWVSRRLGVPIKWTSTRSEAFLSDWQGRDMEMHGKLGLSNDGKIKGYKVEFRVNNGAHTVCYAPPANASRLIPTVYDIENVYLDMKVFLTNTTPVLPFRAAGRPETHYVIERLIDLAAEKLDLGRNILRKKNLVRREKMPFKNAMQMTYDVGDFHAVFDKVIKLMDFDNFMNRKKRAYKFSKSRGISVVPFIETPVGAPMEMGKVVISKSGTTTIYAGTQNHGQGHETTYAQVLGQLLGIPLENIILETGDSNNLPIGGGTHSDRSMRMMGNVLYEISKLIIAKAKPIAAKLLQVTEDKIEFTDGYFTTFGSDQNIDILAVAGSYSEDGSESTLWAEWRQEGRIAAFPYGAAGIEIEIDLETGNLKICNYWIVDDCGQIINPKIVKGQAHGGIVHGIGQAIGEVAFYENSNGQLLTGSFMDYMVPRAGQFPLFNLDSIDVKTLTNPLSIKAGGESGTVAALALVGNAVMNALDYFEVPELEMPFTAPKIWYAIQSSAKASRSQNN